MNLFEDKYCIALVDHINTILEEKDIDVADLAAAANLDRRQVYRLTNKENIPKLSTLVRISLAAGIKPKELHDFKFDFDSYMKENKIIEAKAKKK